MKKQKSIRKRILIVSQNFYPENFGINDITAHLVKSGFDVDVLTGLPNYPVGRYFDGYGVFKRKEKTYKGARVFRCYVFPRLKNSSLGISLNYASFAFFASLKLFKLIFYHYEHVFVYQPSPIFQAIPALILAKIKSIRKTIYVLDIWPDSVYSVVDFKSKFFKQTLQNYSKKTYQKFDTCLITSEGFAHKLAGYGVQKSRIVFLPQWVIPIQPRSIKKPLLKALEKKFVIVFAGNIGVPQNLNILPEATLHLTDINNLHWLIVGDGDALEDLKTQVSKFNLNERFTFTGRRPPEEMSAYYDIADGLVASLKAIPIFSDIIPAKIQSYMAAGKPILCAINGEASRIVQQAKCGFISDAGDAEALASNVRKLYHLSKSERMAMGKNGKIYAEKYYNREELLDQLMQIIKDNK